MTYVKICLISCLTPSPYCFFPESQALHGSLWQSSVIFRNVQVGFGQLLENFLKSSKVVGSLWKIVITSLLVCLYNKQNNTRLLEDMEFLSHVQLYISLVSAVNEWDIELNTQREIPYLCAAMYYSLLNVLGKMLPCTIFGKWSGEPRNCQHGKLYSCLLVQRNGTKGYNTNVCY